MPAPTRTLSFADVRHYVDEQVFGTPPDATAAGRVGIELEWIPIAYDGSTPPPATLRSALPTALPGGSRLTFEPGGQLELSGPPAHDLGDACGAMRADTAAVRTALAAVGVELVGAGIDARGAADRVLDHPRYTAMEEYFDTRWPEGRTMMRNTASIQVNLDVGVAATVDQRWQLAHDLGPVLTACFANSPFDTTGHPSGFCSTRAAVWHAIDPARTAPARVDRRLGARVEWTRYLLDAPVMMIRVDDTRSVVSRRTLPFAEWIANGHELGWPTADDLAYHATTLFPPVRPRGWLELRMIDALPEVWWPVAVAVTTALIDDPSAAAAASNAVAPVGDRWVAAARDGLRDPALAAAARCCFAAARPALARLGADSETCAATDEFFERFVSRDRCPADDLLDAWSWPKPANV
jgi:glutamate--cysteine ligase